MALMSFGRPMVSGIEVFKVTRTEGLNSARRLLRCDSSAPDQRRQIQQIHAALIHAEGWSPQQEALILAAHGCIIIPAWVNSRSVPRRF
jgi:hypothetical protein